MLERLKAILEGTDLSIAEIRKEAFEFGRFLSAAENGRTGKYDAEKLMKETAQTINSYTPLGFGDIVANQSYFKAIKAKGIAAAGEGYKE